jgi:predicted PurR-regulated permease PerM
MPWELGRSSVLGCSLSCACWAVVLLICWIVLPFAVIGIKPLIRQLIKEQKETQRLLASIERGPVPGVSPAKPMLPP